MSEIRQKMCIGLHVKYPLFLSDFNETYFRDKFLKNPRISNVMKIIRWEQSCSMRTDRRTEGET